MCSYSHMQKVMPYVLLCVMLCELMKAYLDHAASNASCATAGTFVPRNLDVVIMQDCFCRMPCSQCFEKACYHMNAMCSSRHVILPLKQDVPVQLAFLVP